MEEAWAAKHARGALLLDSCAYRWLADGERAAPWDTGRDRLGAVDVSAINAGDAERRPGSADDASLVDLADGCKAMVANKASLRGSLEGRNGAKALAVRKAR
ncbi:MAG: hypothetical protein WAS21_06140 [Geminicoccaceae bacterium]